MKKTKNRILYVQRKYPNCIDDWNNDHVRSFLLEKNFISLLSVVVDMNGRVLHMMYLMCMESSQLMFDRLKADTSNEQPLNINTYLRFLHEIKAAMVGWLSCSTRIHKVLCSYLGIIIYGMTLDKSLTVGCLE